MPVGVYIRTKPPWNKGLKNPRLSEKLSGNKNPMYGKTGNKHHNWKGGKNKCKNCNKQLCDYKSQYCIECVKTFIPVWNKGSKGVSKSNSGSFKKGNIPHNKIENGITPLNKLIRHTNEYKEWRLQVFGRDNFTCQECKGRGIYLHPHHKKELYKIIKDNNMNTIEDEIKCSELWDLNNGITLCKECHMKLHGLNKQGVI